MPKEKKELTYEQARARLTEITENLSLGNLGLEDTLKLWEEGEKLAEICQKILDQAQARLEEIQAEYEDEQTD
ncbi:MAG: exodeoxyribonuclease VII small subunit [Candidatus Nanopelagicales bacterium]|jgi:exodeoxyribonuclease VII small subunit